MENNLRIPLIVSLTAHLGLFLISSVANRRVVYLNIPIELMFYGSPGVQEARKIEVISKKKEELVIPKAKKEKKAEKKAAKEEKKPQVIEKKEAAAQDSPSQAGTGAPSARLTLDTLKFPYAYYTSLVVKKVGQNWQWTNDFGNLRALVYFKILKDGSISDGGKKKSSGDKLFAQRAEGAVKLSGPFPPLPQGYTEDSLGIFFEFSFK
jgi:TolA protein